jgi:hypothetical protein
METNLRRTLRGAMASHVFQELPNGAVSHTAASRALADNPLMGQWLEMYGEEIVPAGLKIVDAMAKWPDSGEPNQAACPSHPISHDQYILIARKGIQHREQH